MGELEMIRRELWAIRETLLSLRPEPGGLLGYDGLAERLAVDGKKPCMRRVKELARKYRAILRPVVLGHRSVGFRPTAVEALLAHLAQDPKIGARRL